MSIKRSSVRISTKTNDDGKGGDEGDRNEGDGNEGGEGDRNEGDGNKFNEI